MKADISSVNLGSTKSHDIKNSNIRILPKDYNVLLSAIIDATENERKSFTFERCVTLFGLTDMEFNRNVGEIESLI